MLDFFNVPDASGFRLMVFLKDLERAADDGLSAITPLHALGLCYVLVIFLTVLILCAFPQIHRAFSEGFARSIQATMGTAALVIGIILFAWFVRGGDLAPLYYSVPLLACLLVALSCLFARRYVQWLVSPGIAQFFQGLITSFLLVLAVFATCNYLDYGKWRVGSFLNAYEFYHYYIGAKYAPEVGYTGMYFASLVADAELEEGEPRFSNPRGTIRDLDSTRHVPFKPILDRADEIKEPFSEVRWEEFKKDIDFFKSEMSIGRWNHVLTDKGYNATPVWTSLIDFLFTSRTDTADRRAMTRLALLDLMLIAAASAFVLWAFGPKAVLLMIIVLGTSYVMKYSHMKGAFLRTDFCMSLVVAICLIKKGHYKTAGVLSGYSFLSRIFPAVYFFGLGARFLWQIAPQVWPAIQGSFRRLGLRLHGAVATVLLVAALVWWVALFTVGPWPLVIQYDEPPQGATNWVLSDNWAFNEKPIFGGAAEPGEELGFIGRFFQRLIPMFVFAVAPLLAFGALFAVVGLWALATRRITSEYFQYFLALVTSIAVLVGFSIVYTGGLSYWKEYGEKIGQHNRDVSPWRVGFKYLYLGELSTGANVTYESLPSFGRGNVSDVLRDRAGVFSAVYEEARNQEGEGFIGTVDEQTKFFLQEFKPAIRNVIFLENQILWWTIMGIVLFLSLFLVYGLKDHEAFAWSFVPVFFMVSPTYYYFIMLLIPLLFFSPYTDRPARAVGAILLLLMAFPGYWLYGELRYLQQFPTYYWHSVMYMGLVLYMMLVAAGISLLHLLRRGGPLRAARPGEVAEEIAG